MLRRSLPITLAGLALLASSGCASKVSPAVEVGDTSITDSELLDEVAEWVGNESAVDPSVTQAAAPGAYPMQLVGQIISQRIDFELHRQEFEELGLSLDDDLRDQAIEVVFGDPALAEQALSGFSDDFADAFVDDVARQIAVQEELGDEGYAEWRTGEYRQIHVEVSPRYGSWNGATGRVTPPEGPIDRAAALPFSPQA